MTAAAAVTRVEVGQTWALRALPNVTRVVTADHGGYVDTTLGRTSVGHLLRHWRLVDEHEAEAAGLPAAPVDRNVDAARALLAALGHHVTDDLERDIDRAVDVERMRREHDWHLIALVLGHSVDHARTLTRGQLLDAVRDLTLDRDRCSICPWTRDDFGAGIECGGAAGICPGNTRATVAELAERFPEPKP